MSLADAVLEIVGQMEIAAKEVTETGPEGYRADAMLRRYSSLLQIAVKASQDSVPQSVTMPGDAEAILKYFKMGRTPKVARPAEVDTEVAQGLAREESTPTLTEVIGLDPSDVPVFIPVDPRMPVGARCNVPGYGVCILGEDRKLHVEVKGKQ